MYTIYFNYTQGGIQYEDLAGTKYRPTERGLFAWKLRIAQQLGIQPWDITVTGWEKRA